MDNKRKASGANGGGSEGDERAPKRRKMPPFNLSKQETPESTTSYGLAFLEQLRRTQDKSGRLVAGYFETLPPRKGNEDYYAKTPMPLSLRTLEQKLHRREFRSMAELESWLRRMVKNAKDYYSRHSTNFEDAERIRKAVSNYMTKTNPAYKKIPSYSSQPVPIPEGYEPHDDEYGDDQGEKDAEGEEDAEADEEEDEEQEEEEQQEEEEDDEDEDEDDDGDDDGDSDAEAIPKRRGGRPAIRGKAKPDHEFEGVPYKGLTFQQAQEKIVEETIRKPDDEEPTWAKFEAFMNLPPRSLKEYFSIIQNPLSLKGLQKLVKGIHGRSPPTGVSEFKGWAAFEEKASLLWDNAHYFNEEGSEIYNQATELKEFFEAEIARAKAVVQEPPQPKIKLRVPQAQETPAPTLPKKITIHVGGSRAQTTASPAPQAAGTPAATTSSEGGMNGTTAQRFAGPNGVSGVPMSLPQLERMRSISGAVASPSPPIPGVKQELANGQSPAVTPRLSGAPPQPSPYAPPMHTQPQPQFLPPGAPVQNGYHPPPVERPQPIYNKVKRAPGRGLSDALITNLCIRGHPNLGKLEGSRFNIHIPADPVYAQHSTTVHVPNQQYKLQVILRIAPLEQQNRAYRLFVVANNQVQVRTPPFPIADMEDLDVKGNPLVFDANLSLGMNEIQVHIVAALPKGQKLPGGEDCEVEVFRVVAQLLRA